MKDKINHKIGTTLQSIDGIQPAEPKPFLLTRVNALLRSEKPTIWSAIAAYIQRPAVAICSVTALLIINIAVMKTNNYFTAKNNVTKRIASSKYDFSVNVSGIYDMENQEP